MKGGNIHYIPLNLNTHACLADFLPFENLELAMWMTLLLYVSFLINFIKILIWPTETGASNFTISFSNS
jgi:hypothetical protein